MSTHTHVQVIEEVRQARWLVALSAVMIGCGGFLLGVQIDAQGGASGTGLTPLAMGALVALTAWWMRRRAGSALPRDGTGVFGALAAYLGTSFLVAGVLVPGGPWMFAELLLLLVLLGRGARDVTRPAWLWWFVVLLLFRLWITWQGSIHQWQVLSVPIPILSWIPLDFLEPVQSVSLGSFTPAELAFPPLGLDFRMTVAIWSAGFALCAGGTWMIQLALREHENDRIHERIHTLPAPLAQLIERILPESEWESLGLHGLSERELVLAIEQRVRERVDRQRSIVEEYRSLEPLRWTNPGGFQGSVQAALHALEEKQA